MAYITRDDGVQFVIPSYRDVITMKSASGLKKEILTLSTSYGEYITLQQKSAVQYEVAFSPDTGYLLGESIWHHFSRPVDMVYCEAVPNTAEAILVIVVSGSVYLDGRFHIDSIPDELVVFLTQKNSFDVYVYGDVPISQSPEIGKFSFEAETVKSFTVLNEPVFQNLTLDRAYQLQLVEKVLKEHKIGVFPVGKAIIGIVILGSLWFMWKTITAESEAPTAVVAAPVEQNAYIAFNQVMTSPAPDAQLNMITENIKTLFSMPGGWLIDKVLFEQKQFVAFVRTKGTNIAVLSQWAAEHNAAVTIIGGKGIVVGMPLEVANRPTPNKIYKVEEVVENVMDQVATVYPLSLIQFIGIEQKGIYKVGHMQITIDQATPVMLAAIADRLKGRSLLLTKVELNYGNKQFFSGTISIDAVGN